MASLSLKHIYKIYPNGFEAVKDFNLEIEDKEFIIFVGPSGCGKSTTLRMIAGLEDISDGEFMIDGKIMNDVEPKDRDIAMVFQNYALYPHMTVRDNMAFGLKLRKTPKHEIKKKVGDASTILDLSELLDRKPVALSGGQRQRVAMGRAIVREPKVFLMDEPLSNLDAKLRVQMRTEISALHQRLGATIIYVTHDQTEAMTLGTRIVVMKDGVIQQVASPRDLYNKPDNLFVAGFIGSPQMNFVNAECRAEGDDVYLDFDKFSIKLPKPKGDALRNGGYIGKEVIMGIRPEKIFESEHAMSVFPEDCKIEVTVNGYELLGSEVLLYFNLLNEKPAEIQRQFTDDAYANVKKVHWTAKVDAATTARYGSTITLALDPNKIHVFDKETEKTIVN
ncbi:MULTISPECIES: ABC transporter ATP-binding protein [Ruminococcus]|uniref:ABC transporter, ATP-binding protein n=1 Tax=Ruminococcus albus 8 TaxID=246199 RepID=E9SHU2_RUMAL|nr:MULTISPECIES: sn-glycerol-3-phosphate ABC transporter ATP-binding protein UgpC [Ruminococcus]MBE6874145.1 sn-glycerol-3-phosphate ABC transporter ATP-binding protein UgpC [Ruminococcus albus]EGC01130.1 ABC transporter, ATP-binding protein [Ruminococcus albus 8]MBQ9541443.1 sn-glycerol-3-phosphate ABC transporter ATP-binding protein UgpC [Ruminococcus sp.]MBR0529878.1 sn-glycerol-3-phosphate ABC transporter ATP-binding protein UgpC [Ruminococcus sp.]MCC3349525.1 sn-glycerol-3-phosphate ABC t